MKRTIPPRPYSTFSELKARWQRSENDLCFAIICGALKPSIRLNGLFKCLAWDVDSAGNWIARAVENSSEIYGDEILPQGWHYLQDPVQTGPFSFQFIVTANERDAEKVAFPLCNWHLLKNPMTVEDVKQNAVFLDKEISRYEATHREFGNTALRERVEKPLSTTERNTLLCIIGALCKEAKLDYKKHAKTAGLILSTAASMGVSIGETTIEGHLKKIPDALATRMK